MLSFFPLYFQMAREDSKDGKYDHHLVLPLQLIGKKKCQSRNMSFYVLGMKGMPVFILFASAAYWVGGLAFYYQIF